MYLINFWYVGVLNRLVLLIFRKANLLILSTISFVLLMIDSSGGHNKEIKNELKLKINDDADLIFWLEYFEINI